jgi:hypothetical protein
MSVIKDVPGGLRGHCVTGPGGRAVWGTFVLDSTGETTVATVEAPTTREETATRRVDGLEGIVMALMAQIESVRSKSVLGDLIRQSGHTAETGELSRTVDRLVAQGKLHTFGRYGFTIVEEK